MNSVSCKIYKVLVLVLARTSSIKYHMFLIAGVSPKTIMLIDNNLFFPGFVRHVAWYALISNG